MSSRGTDPLVGDLVEREAHLAFRNAVKLALSLAVTVAVALVFRRWVPKELGPEAFGRFAFAESFTLMWFVFTGLGVEPYINREVSRRSEHASEFYGTLVLVQTGVTVVLLGLIALCLAALQKSSVEWQLVYWFALGEYFRQHNLNFAALLESQSEVTEFALINVGAKILWGGAVVATLALGGSVVLLGIAYAATEIVKAPLLFAITRRHLDLKLRADWAAGFAVLSGGLPYFLNTLAHTAYGRIDVTMLSWLVDDAEVGFYGAAINMNVFILLLLPVLVAVVLPMGSRVGEQSETALNQMMHTTVRGALTVCVPMALIMMLHAPQIVRVVFGPEFAPSARSLQLLAPMIPLGYACTLFSIHLIDLGHIWRVTRVSAVGFAINPILNGIGIPWAAKNLSAGGAGMMAGATSLATEVVIFSLLLRQLGKRSSDPKLGMHALKLGALVAALCSIHVALPALGLWRIPAQLFVYGALGYAIGAVPLGRWWGFVTKALKRG